ncbi:hypothetical protein BO79DRAFT_224544 [Aspergillus costaricaensis CBS 115574]|uniref:Uncharacterized protein n=1 Tax=Aspergillus costaricaensis CBS 115574 TaxID=1448317 RepID=A0ACD1IRK0_9EURO|nr:hypothetical protein BO79DRAFT_224544 [Aspergillus costaricaensis CBS 115574]RAK93019.1 hypothetical protein BO79DRAFT_224544 [Aspergillus costaricaensis CBS 115574]
MYGGFPIWRPGPLCSISKACCVDSSETGELRHCSPSFSWLTASCCPNCSGGDTLATAAVAADSLIGKKSHQNNSKTVFRRCPHFGLGLVVVVVVSVAAVYIGNPVPTLREIWRWAGES